MKKRIVSFVIAIFIFVFNSVSVFALDSYLDSNFQDLPLYENYLNTINLNLTNYKYIYYAKCQIYWGQPGTFIYSNTPLEISVSDSDSHTIIIKNNSSDISNIYLFSHYGEEYHDIESTASVSFTFPNGGNFTDVQLLIYNKDCVSQTYCSSDIYIEYKEDTGDYEEDGVVIKGLTSFFNKMTSILDSILETIKNLVSDIIGIPEEGYFSEKIETIKNSINEKYNIDILISFISDMQTIDSSAPDISYNKNLMVNNQTIPFNFHIDFSWFSDDIKNTIFLLLRAVGYPLLIIYNLNQFYLLFRGRKFFETGGDDE